MATNTTDIALVNIRLVESYSKFLSEDLPKGGTFQIITTLQIPDQHELKEPLYNISISLEINIEGYLGESISDDNIYFQLKCRAEGIFQEKHKKPIVAKDIHNDKDVYASLIHVWCKNYIDSELMHMKLAGLNIPWYFQLPDSAKLLNKKSKKKKTKKKKITKKKSTKKKSTKKNLRRRKRIK